MTAPTGRTAPTGTTHTATAADRVIRWSATASVATVTGIAAVISYRHTLELVRQYGETGTIARVLPLTVDGLIATCSLVILDCARRNRRPPWHAWALLAAGIAATLGANIAHGAEHGPIGALVAGWPALVAVGSFELATRLLRGDHTTRAVRMARSVNLRRAKQADGTRSAPTQAQPEGDPLVVAAREQFSALLDEGRTPSLRALKTALKIGHTRAIRVQAALSDTSHRAAAGAQQNGPPGGKGRSGRS